MRRLSFLIPSAALLLAACGGSSAPPAPQQTLADLVDDFHPAALAFAEQLRIDFEDNDLDPEELHRCRGFDALREASQMVAKEFPITDADREDLALFAFWLGRVREKPKTWDLSQHTEPAASDSALASINLDPEASGAATFLVRLTSDKKRGWKLASWPPRTRPAFQPYPAHSQRLILNSWAAGTVPPDVQERFRSQFGSKIPADSAYSQVEWQRKVLHHSLTRTVEGADPWQRLKLTVQDVLIPMRVQDEAGLPAEPLVILAGPDVPTALISGVLDSLAQPKTRWPQIWIGIPGEFVDRCFLLDQRPVWETSAENVILRSGGSEDEWSAALAGSSATGAVGLSPDPQLPASALFADLERLQKRKLARIFIALPVKGE